MAAPGWPDAFLRVLGSKEAILNPGYLFSVFDNGEHYCKACGGFFSDSHEDHLTFHETELDIVLEDKRVQASLARQEALRAARAAKHTIFSGDANELAI